MSKKAATTTVKKVAPKKPAEKEIVHETKQDGEGSANFLENLNLEELTSSELISKIGDDQQYEEAFAKLNELFLGYSNDMTVLDEKRKKVIELMKSMHDVIKKKQGPAEEDGDEEGEGEEGDEGEGEGEGEEAEEEIVTKPVVKPAVKKSAQATKPPVKKVTEPEEAQAENNDEEVEVVKKPAVKKSTVPNTGKKVATSTASTASTAPSAAKKPATTATATTAAVKKPATTTTATTATTATTGVKKPAVKKTGK